MSMYEEGETRFVAFPICGCFAVKVTAHRAGRAWVGLCAQCGATWTHADAARNVDHPARGRGK